LDHDGHAVPLLDCSFAAATEEWDQENASWSKGEHAEQVACPEWAGAAFEEWHGTRPDSSCYMPDWPSSERTHYQMYETISEGTPISTVKESPEALARWLADNHANAGAGSTASYEAWLRVCRGGWAPTGVITPGR